MNVLTHLRTIFVLFGAFAFFCALITQMLARALGYPDAIGENLFELGGAPIYMPFSFLSWTSEWASVAPSLQLLAILIACVCALAAYSCAILVAGLEPMTLPEPSPWRGLASWDELGHRGLLGDDGLALGAVRRHAWARHDIVRQNGKKTLFLGDPAHTNDAFLAALSNWRGVLILFDATGALTERLGRTNVLRVAPACCDSLSFNPLLAIRGGAYAWDDARQLAAALLGDDREHWRTSNSAEAFALLMLDHLRCAPPETRMFSAIRGRLLDHATLLNELCGRWTKPPKLGAALAAIDMARAARALRADAEQAIASFEKIETALETFADAGLNRATSTHQISLQDFVAAKGASTLVLSMARYPDECAKPLMRAFLAQLAIACANAPTLDDVLVATDARAAQFLNAADDASPFAELSWHAAVQATECSKHRHPTQDVEDVVHFNPIMAIGQQTRSTGEALCKLGGHCLAFRRLRQDIPIRWSALFPLWLASLVDRLPEHALMEARPDEAFLVSPHCKPARVAVLLGRGRPTFRAAEGIAPAAHDWGMAPATFDLFEQIDVAASAPPVPAKASTKLRRVLGRKTASKSSAKKARPR